jgi:AraC-like DNA-binding protein
MGSPGADFRTRDVGEAEEHLRAQYGDLRLSNEPLEFAQRVQGDAALGIADFHYGGRLVVGGDVEFVTVVTAPVGSYSWDIGPHHGVSSREPVLVEPGAPVAFRIEHLSMTAVTFDPVLLRSTAAALFADDDVRLRFRAPTSRSPRLGMLWAGLVRLARESDPGSLVSASAAGALRRLLLTGFDLADRGTRRRASALGRWLGYRRAVQFIDDHVSLPITLVDIATASGLSRDDLDTAFRTHARSGGTALDHLRRARLAAAHLDLLGSDPASARLDEIAARWGFSTRGRFGRLYREEFGVDPRSTFGG